jgi:hypothetical protein
VVDETGIVIAATTRCVTVGNACFNGNISTYKSTIVFKFESFTSTSELVIHCITSTNQLSFVLQMISTQHNIKS